MPSKKTDAIRDEINRTMKKEVLHYANDSKYQITRIRTGSLVLDRLLGGGMARGRYTELFGNYSTLKTYTALRVIAHAQKQGQRCLFADAERSFDPEWATALGVDISSLEIYTPEYGEELIDVIEAALRSKEYGVIVVDSIAALIPKPELEQSAEKEHMGRMGQLTSKMMRRWTAALSTATCMILINQVREKIGQLWGRPETTVGGRAIAFYAGQRIEFRKGEKIKATVKGKEKVVGYVVTIRIEKDKTGPNAERVGQVSYTIGEGIDIAEELVSLGELDGFVKRKGNSYVYGGTSISGRDAFKRHILESKAATKSLRKKVRRGR